MTRRIRTSIPLVCDCGARGSAILEEDNTPDRMEGGANPEWVEVTGLFALRSDQIVCVRCGRNYATGT